MFYFPRSTRSLTCPMSPSLMRRHYHSVCSALFLERGLRGRQPRGDPRGPPTPAQGRLRGRAGACARLTVMVPMSLVIPEHGCCRQPPRHLQPVQTVLSLCGTVTGSQSRRRPTDTRQTTGHAVSFLGTLSMDSQDGSCSNVLSSCLLGANVSFHKTRTMENDFLYVLSSTKARTGHPPPIPPTDFKPRLAWKAPSLRRALQRRPPAAGDPRDGLCSWDHVLSLRPSASESLRAFKTSFQKK